MDEPIVSWYVKNINDEFVESDTQYAGSYTQTMPLIVPLRIWNNRYGTKDVASIENLRLSMYFSDYEDSAMLSYLTVNTKNSQAVMTVANERATAVFLEHTKLDGKANDGTDKNNPENYIDIEIKLDVPTDVHLKMHDLKNLIIEVVSE